jgi:hypothetical protein
MNGMFLNLLMRNYGFNIAIYSDHIHEFFSTYMFEPIAKIQS